MPDELKPCLVCGHEKLHIRTTKTTVSMPVSIRCAMCDFTVEMQNWKSLTEWWNSQSRPHQIVTGKEHQEHCPGTWDKTTKHCICDEFAGDEVEELAQKIRDSKIYCINPISTAKFVIEQGYRQQGKLAPLDSNKSTDIFKNHCAEYLKKMGHDFNEPNDWPYGWRDFYCVLYQGVRDICAKFAQPSVPSFENIQLKAQEVLVDFWYRDRKDKKPSVDIINCSHAIATAIHKLLTEQKG